MTDEEKRIQKLCSKIKYQMKRPALLAKSKRERDAKKAAKNG